MTLCRVLAVFETVFRASPVSIDQIVSDFDGVTFHISTPESKSKVRISMAIRCFKDLLKYGAQQELESEYGNYIVEPEPGYDFSIIVDLENLPSSPGLLFLLQHCAFFALIVSR